jgi:hypothetical protein
MIKSVPETVTGRIYYSKQEDRKEIIRMKGYIGNIFNHIPYGKKLLLSLDSKYFL